MKYPSHDLRNLRLCNDVHYISIKLYSITAKKKTINRAILSLFLKNEIDYKNYRNSETSFSFQMILFINVAARKIYLIYLHVHYLL